MVTGIIRMNQVLIIGKIMVKMPIKRSLRRLKKMKKEIPKYEKS